MTAPSPAPPNSVNLGCPDRTTGVPPVREDSASRLSALETTGWKPVVHDRQDACPPAKSTVLPASPALRLADGVLVINLDQRPERLERFAAMAALTSVLDGWQRIPAVNGVELPGYDRRPWFRQRKRDKCWAGRAGCTLSHRKAIAYARDAGWDSVLILEDDVQPGEGFDAAVKNFLDGTAACPRPSSACFLGLSQQVGPSLKLRRLDDVRSIYQIFGCTGTFAYILQRDSFDWLLAKLPTAETIWPWVARHRAIDRWYARNLSGRFTVHAVSPSLIGHYSSFSDIGQRAGANLLVEESEPEEHDHLRPCGPIAFSLGAALLRIRFSLTKLVNRVQCAIKRQRGF